MLRRLMNVGPAVLPTVGREAERVSSDMAAAGRAAAEAARAGAEAARAAAEAGTAAAMAPAGVASEAGRHMGEAAAAEARRGVAGARELIGAAEREGSRFMETAFGVEPRPPRPGTLPGIGVTPTRPLPGTFPGTGVPPTFPFPGAAFPTPPVIFPTPLPFPPVFEPVKTATELARSAIQMLDAAAEEPLNAALSTVKAKRIPGDRLVDYLERRVRVGEVLQKLASHWTQDTREDFGAAFQLGVDKLDVMDLIVAISILSDPDLDDEIRAENLVDAPSQDVLESRHIVWQHPPPGTVLEPPYMVLVAVEHRDVAEAEKVVDSILRQLTVVDGYRLTQAAADRVRGGPLRRPIR